MPNIVLASEKKPGTSHLVEAGRRPGKKERDKMEPRMISGLLGPKIATTRDLQGHSGTVSGLINANQP